MNRNTVAILLLLLLACIWGSSFILMKRGMFTENDLPIFSDAQVGALRMLLASSVMVPFAIKSIRKLLSIRDFASLLIVGCCGNFFPAFLFTYAETELSSGYSGMLNSFTPIFTLLLGIIFFRQKMTSFQLGGVLIAFCGIIYLMWLRDPNVKAGGFSHSFAVIVATFFYATSLNFIKHRLSHLGSLEITSLAFLLLFIPSLVACISLDVSAVFEFNPHAMQGFGYIALLSVVGTAFAVFLFNKVIGISSTIFASSVTYLIPIVAVFIGLADNEKISSLQVICMLIILSGVFLANYGQLLFSKLSVTRRKN